MRQEEACHLRQPCRTRTAASSLRVAGPKPWECGRVGGGRGGMGGCNGWAVSAHTHLAKTKQVEGDAGGAATWVVKTARSLKQSSMASTIFFIVSVPEGVSL